MKVVIFAGGLGTRLMEETTTIPKPMIEVGSKPILWHIMKIYAAHGFNEFIICCGYKGNVIKEYFLNYHLNNADITVDVGDNSIELHQTNSDKFKVTLVNTGLGTNTAGRLKKIKKHIDGTFMLTYGDGVSDIDIPKLIAFHKAKKKKVTLTAVKDRSRYGELSIDDSGFVKKFEEKPEGYEKYINGGFFIMEPDVFDYLETDVEDVQWEKGPLVEISKNNDLVAYKHHGFWKSMDSLRDKKELEDLWDNGNAPWKIW
jgi:glucose-1-phosphate cytidylyltransferase|tara:strand:+ start:1506 stop:2279 length:774 start_codon:yes stop_codon:yes gene_type:complete